MNEEEESRPDPDVKVEQEAEEEAADFEEEEETHGEHKRLQLAIALSIAVVSIMGALLGWRAELHASSAADLDQDAIAASLAATNEATLAGTLAATAESNWDRYTRLGDEASRLDPAGCANASSASIAQAEASVACSVQVVFSGYNDPKYISHGIFDTSAYAADVVAASRYGIDSDPVPYERSAAHQRALEDRLLYLSIGVVVALAAFTLARLVKSRKRILSLCVPGWLVLAVSAALFVVTES